MTPAVRVDLSPDAPSFRPLTVAVGIPMLDRWNSIGSLLGSWLGRLAAEPVWEGDTVGFYVRAGLYAYGRAKATLTGRVYRAADGRPVDAAAIQIEGTSLSTTTDDQGALRLQRLWPGAITARVSAPGFREESIRVKLPWGREASVEVPLVGGLQLTGRVLHVVGNEELPVAKASVLLEGRETISVETDPDGNFVLERIPPGAAKGRVSAPGFRPVTFTAMASMEQGTPLRVVLLGGGQITGRVVYEADTAVPITGAEVGLARMETPKARTDDDGRFVLDGVPPIALEVWASAKGFRRSSTSANPQKTSICIALVGDAVLTGTAVRGDTSQPAALGVTLDADNRQRAVPSASVEIRIGDYRKTYTSAANGGFTLGDVPSGPIELTARAAGYREARIEKTVNPKDAWIEVPMTRIPSATVTGKVIDAGGSQPIANAKVTVAGSELKVSTNADGKFELSGVPVPESTLLVSAPDHVLKEVARKWVDGRQDVGDVALSPAATVRGRVVRALDGQPVEQAEVAITGARAAVRTDVEGKFVFVGIPFGPATMRVAADGYRAQEVKSTLSAGSQELKDVTLVGDTEAKDVTVDADNWQRAVPNASIEVRIASYRATLTAAANGGFTVGQIPSGQIDVTAKAAGYRDAHVSKRITPADAWIEIPVQRGTTLSGSVVNAIAVDKNGDPKPVPDARVSVKVGDVDESAYTNAQGRFEIRGIPAGNAEVRIAAPGFEPLQLTHPTGSSTPLRVVLSPDLPLGEVRIVLTWGPRPRDLDAHLYGPRAFGGGRFHLYHRTRSADGCTLDVDAKAGFGPETMTVRGGLGRYQYYVAHPENLQTDEGKPLAGSQAQVRVYYKGARSMQPYTIPAKRQGPVWHPFDIVVGAGRRITIQVQNKWYRDLPAE